MQAYFYKDVENDYNETGTRHFISSLENGVKDCYESFSVTLKKLKRSVLFVVNLYLPQSKKNSQWIFIFLE